MRTAILIGSYVIAQAIGGNITSIGIGLAVVSVFCIFADVIDLIKAIDAIKK